MSQVSVGAGNDVWGTDCPFKGADNCSVYQYIAGPSPTWKLIPGELNLIEVGANGDVWGINAAGSIYYYFFNGANSGWVNIPGSLGTLSVGADGTVWGINAFLQIYRYVGSTNGTAGTFVNVPGSLEELSVATANDIWGVSAFPNLLGNIYNYTTGFHQVPGTLDELWASFDGAVWGVNANGSAYQWDGTKFNFIGNNVTQVVLGNSANVWATFDGNPQTGAPAAVYNWF
jgi:hypothetical protein